MPKAAQFILLNVKISLYQTRRGGAGGSMGFSVRYQGELLGIWDLQNRDPRRKSPPETEKWLAYYHPSVGGEG